MAEPTAQMYKDLAAGFRSLESTVAEVQRDLQHTQEHVQNLRDKSVQSYNDVHALQVGLGDTNINLDKLSKELGRVGQATQQLQVNERGTKEKMTLLEESKKMSDTRMESLIKEVSAEKEILVRLQEVVDRQINEDVRVLRKEVANTNLTLNQAVAEQKSNAEFARENREACRDARVDIEKMFNEVKKTNTVTNILENRLASTAQGLQQSWAKCSELSDALVKTMECYDKTKARVADAEGVAKEISIFGKRTREDLNQAVRVMESNADRVSQALKLIDEGQEATQDLRHELNAVKQSQANSARQYQQMKGTLAEMRASGGSSGGLKDISTMLLPSIDGSQNDYSTLLGSSTMSSPGRPQSRK